MNFVNILGKDGYFDAKVNELRETTDPIKRNQILVDLQKLEQKYLYKLPLFILQNIYYVNTAKVKCWEYLGIHGLIGITDSKIGS